MEASDSFQSNGKDDFFLFFIFLSDFFVHLRHLTPTELNLCSSQRPVFKFDQRHLEISDVIQSSDSVAVKAEHFRPTHTEQKSLRIPPRTPHLVAVQTSH